MPISREPDLPISYVPITGPGLDTLDRRKENSSIARIAAIELRESYNTVKDELFAGIKALVQAVPSVASRPRGRGQG
ncbi:MAG: hypothetical protein ACXW3X_01895 [Rhodoplanes sp.]